LGGKGEKDRIVPLYYGFRDESLNLLPLKIKRITLQIHFSNLCMKVLGRHCNFHQLRHTFAVISIEKGVSINNLQQALGHSRLDTTGIYTKTKPEAMLNDFRNAWSED
jgi:site-specific recombinase XerD